MATDSDTAPPVPVDPAISAAAASARPLRRSLSHGAASASTIPAAAADSAAPPLRRSLSHGSASLIGRRRVMEDTVAVAPVLAVPGYEFFAVYDGHGGARVAEACRDRMHRLMAEEVVAYGGLGPEAVAACFARMDAEMADGVAAVDMTVGSTAVVVLLGAERIVVANCGDSRAVLCRGGAPMALSSDHKPNREDEMERVEAAGGRVIEWDGYRVLGVLATSRSIGDHYLRPYVISEPEVMVIDRTEKDEFLILASDGLWDVMSNEVACRATRYCLAGYGAKKFPEAISGRTASEAATLLAQLAMSRGSKDNISVVVVELNKLQRRKHLRS